VGLRQPRLRPDRGPHQGGEAGLPVGRRHRARRQPAPRGALQDRLHAAGALLHVSGAGADVEVAAREERAVDDHLRGASAVHQQPRVRGVHQALSRAGGESRHRGHERRGAGRGVVHSVADPRSRGPRRRQPRRQGDRGVAQEEQGGHHHRPAALRRPEQLRRRPHARQAGAERPLGDGVAEGVRGARREPRGPVVARKRP